MERILSYEFQIENVCWISAKELKIEHKFIENKKINSFKPIYDVLERLKNKDIIDNDLIIFCYKVIYCFKDFQPLDNLPLDLYDYYKSLISIINNWSTLSFNQTYSYDTNKKNMYDNILLPIKESIYCETLDSIQRDYNNVLTKIKTLTDGILFELKSIKISNNQDESINLINKWIKVCKLLIDILNKFSTKMNVLGVRQFNDKINNLKYFIANILELCNLNEFDYIENIINSFNIDNYKIYLL